MGNELQLIFETDATDFHLQAAESRRQFLVDTAQHLIGRAHPYEPVYRQLTITISPWAVEDYPTATSREVGKCCLIAHGNR